jgi:hypothetical protein
VPLPQQRGQRLLGPFITVHQPHLARRVAHASDEIHEVLLDCAADWGQVLSFAYSLNSSNKQAKDKT